MYNNHKINDIPVRFPEVSPKPAEGSRQVEKLKKKNINALFIFKSIDIFSSLSRETEETTAPGREIPGDGG